MGLEGLKKSSKIMLSEAKKFVENASLRENPTNRDQAVLIKLSHEEKNKIEEGFKKSSCRSKQAYMRSLMFGDNDEN